MATLTSKGKFTKINQADALTAINAYIDAIYAAADAGFTPGAVVMTLDMDIVANTGDTTTWTAKLRTTVRASAYGTLKTNLAELLDEFGDMVTASGDYYVITAVTGTVTLEITYT